MNPEKRSFGHASAQTSVPRPPPLPAPRPLQRARDAASRFLGYSSPAPSSQADREDDRFTHGSSQFPRSSSLSATQNATATHRTGLEIRTVSINDSGSHAIIAGKEIFKTIKIENGHCAEDFNLRTAIRSTPTTASGKARTNYSIDIADVAWAKGASGDYVAAATSSGKIIVYDLGHAGLQAAQLHEHFRHVHNVTFNPHEGSLLLSGSQDGTVRLWDLRDVRNQASTIQSKRKFSGQSDGVRDVKWSPTEGVDFAFGTDNGEIQRWDIRNLKAAKVKIPAHGLACNTVDWHPDGKHILSASSEKVVRVFDVSSSRPKKVSWEIRTPHPVMLARWRPSCQSAMPQDSGAQQCTQIVTAYDRKHPIMHVWDFRRPYLPFRELHPYQSSPTDMLWHSQDLLWTVGEGTFLQTDIQHTQKVIDRCNLQTIGVSPLGDLSFIAQVRQQRRKPKSHSLPHLDPNESRSLSASPETSYLSRSWADDGLDHAFLSVLPVKRQPRSHSNSRVHGAFGSSTYNANKFVTIKLDDILFNRMSFRPPQIACRGRLPSHNDCRFVSFVSQQSRSEILFTLSDDELLQEVEGAFKANEDVMQSLGFLQAAQTWRIVAHCAIKHLKDRKALKRKRVSEKSRSSQMPDPLRTSVESLAKRLAAQHLKSPTQSPGTLRPTSNIAHQLALPESTSRVPTPLVRPAMDGVASSTSHAQLLPDPDTDEKITLPPSLSSTHTSPPRDPHEEAGPSERRLTAGNLEDLQRIESARQPADRIDLVQRWSSQPKPPLSLDTVDANGIKIPPAKLEHHGSVESFQFLEDMVGSRGSSFPASLGSEKSTLARLVAERPSRRKRTSDAADHLASTGSIEDIAAVYESMFFEGSGTLENSAAQTKDNSGNTSMEASNEDIKVTTVKNTDETDFAFHHTEEPASPRRRISGFKPESNAVQNTSVFGDDNTNKKRHRGSDNITTMQAVETALFDAEPNSPADSFMEEAETDLELNSPWTLISMLTSLINHYTAEQPYPQMASLLVLLLGPLLPRTHPVSLRDFHATVSGYVDHFLNTLHWDPEDVPSLVRDSLEQSLRSGLHPLQVESIISTYHEQLLSYQLFDDAAELRKIAYPAYPSVYEDFVKDNSVHLKCGHCGKPMTQSGRDKPPLRCKTCQNTQSTCVVCWEPRSPFANETKHSGRLRSHCLLCGHGGHAACLDEWFVLAGGDGCPTEGCLCDCVDGAWRWKKLQEASVRERGQQKVKSDEWRAQESKAVESARRLV